MERPAVEVARLEQVAREYQGRGYRVDLSPGSHKWGLPVAPDLVAEGPNEVVVVQVKSRRSMTDATYAQLTELSELVARRPAWRLEIVIADPVVDETVADLIEASPSRELVMERAAQALTLQESGQSEAALLLAWSALEGASRVRQQVDGEKDDAELSAKQLYSLGLLSDRQYDLVERASHHKTLVAHGLPPADDFDEDLATRVAHLARQLADESYPRVTEMVDWFMDNYEDPANGVPWDEGEYVYVLGGPYHALEELQEQFPEVDFTDIEEAAEEIERSGTDWIRKGVY
jgi:Holliday junction resolvase